MFHAYIISFVTCFICILLYLFTFSWINLLTRCPVPVFCFLLDIECNPSCPIVLGRPFLRTIGAVIDMKEGNIKFQFPLKKGMEQFPRKKMKYSNVTSVKTNYNFGFSGLDNT